MLWRLVLGSGALCWAACAAGEVLEPRSIEQTVATYLENAVKAAYPDGDVAIEVLPIDRRLRFEACATDGLTLSHQGTRLHGRVSVSVRCTAPVSWSMYSSANVSVQRRVVVTQRAVPRGSRISDADLVLAPRELATLREGYLTSFDQAAGTAAKQNLAPGTALETRDLVPAILVSRGERVQLASIRGGITVMVHGEALRDGTDGEQIPVRNLQSERLVQAWVTGTGTVSTTPSSP